MSNINTIIDEVIAAYNDKSATNYFRHLYSVHENVLNRHKNSVLTRNLGCEVTLTGRLCRRGDGTKGNLNLITPAWINGVKVEHLHVYDEVIDCAEVNPHTGMFIAENMKVYKFGRHNSNKFTDGLGIKPISAPVWEDRNEIV